MKNTQYSVWSTENSHGMFAAIIVIISLILVSSPMFSIQPQAELQKNPFDLSHCFYVKAVEGKLLLHIMMLI